MSPDQLEAVATLLYVEMLEAGFTHVGEFHYLHHAPDGRPYADRAEMAGRIAAAADASGIGLTLLPVFYDHADFGGAPATDGQHRFVNDLDGFAKLLEGCRRLARSPGGPIVGVAPHSLRAATAAEIAAILAMAPEGPVHIHIAEQVKEVDDCLAWCGQRPVAYLLDHLAVDARWGLIHATHVESAEVKGLAATGGGRRSLSDHRGQPGRRGLRGSVLPVERRDLRHRIGLQRAGRRGGGAAAARVFASPRRAGPQRPRTAARFDGNGHRPGGGARALRGERTTGIAAGAPADLVSLDADHVALHGLDAEAILDAFVFVGGSALIDAVWSGGVKRVKGGRHRSRPQAERRFKDVMTQLRAK